MIIIIFVVIIRIFVIIIISIIAINVTIFFPPPLLSSPLPLPFLIQSERMTLLINGTYHAARSMLHFAFCASHATRCMMHNCLTRVVLIPSESFIVVPSLPV